MICKEEHWSNPFSVSVEIFCASNLPEVSLRCVVVMDLEVSCAQVYSACVTQFLKNEPNTFVSTEHDFKSVMPLILILKCSGITYIPHQLDLSKLIQSAYPAQELIYDLVGLLLLKEGSIFGCIYPYILNGSNISLSGETSAYALYNMSARPLSIDTYFTLLSGHLHHKLSVNNWVWFSNKLLTNQDPDMPTIFFVNRGSTFPPWFTEQAGTNCAFIIMPMSILNKHFVVVVVMDLQLQVIYMGDSFWKLNANIVTNV